MNELKSASVLFRQIFYILQLKEVHNEHRQSKNIPNGYARHDGCHRRSHFTNSENRGNVPDRTPDQHRLFRTSGTMVFTSVCRMMFMGIPPLALTGAVFGAFLSGVFYRASHGKIICAVIGEIFGTGIIGSLVSYPVMAFLMGRSGLNAFFYTPMFLAATCMGGTIAYFFLKALSHSGMLAKFQQSLGAKVYDRKSDKNQTTHQSSTAADSLHH